MTLLTRGPPSDRVNKGYLAKVHRASNLCLQVGAAERGISNNREGFGVICTIPTELNQQRSSRHLKLTDSDVPVGILLWRKSAKKDMKHPSFTDRHVYERMTTVRVSLFVTRLEFGTSLTPCLILSVVKRVRFV